VKKPIENDDIERKALQIVNSFERRHLRGIELHTERKKFDATKPSSRIFFDKQMQLLTLLNHAKQDYYKALELAFKGDRSALTSIDRIAKMQIEVLAIADNFMYPSSESSLSSYKLDISLVCNELGALYNPYEFKKADFQSWFKKDKWDLHAAISLIAGSEPDDWDNNVKYRLMLEFSNTDQGKIYQLAKKERNAYGTHSTYGTALVFKGHGKEAWINWALANGIKVPREILALADINIGHKDNNKAKKSRLIITNPFNPDCAWHQAVSDAFFDFFRIKGQYPTAKSLMLFIEERKIANTDAYEAIVKFNGTKKPLTIKDSDWNDNSRSYGRYKNLVTWLRKANR